MSARETFPTNLELRESDERGEVKAGLSHQAGGMFLLHVQELAAEGEPVGAITVVHDAGEHGGRYEDLAFALAERGWAVSLPHLRGHGRSEGERGHSAGLREVVRDLGDIVDHLAYMAPEVPRVLMGHGLGALWVLARAFEAGGDVAGLVLAAPLVEPSFELPRPKGGLRGLFSKVGPTSAGRIPWLPDALSLDEEAQRARRADQLVHDVITLRAGEQAHEAARFVDRLGELSCPVLVLQGADDPLVDVARVRSLSGPKLETSVFEGLRHDLFHGPGSDAVVATLCAWLQRCFGGA